jgi:hypothetical protein
LDSPGSDGGLWVCSGDERDPVEAGVRAPVESGVQTPAAASHGPPVGHDRHPTWVVPSGHVSEHAHGGRMACRLCSRASLDHGALCGIAVTRRRGTLASEDWRRGEWEAAAQLD